MSLAGWPISAQEVVRSRILKASLDPIYSSAEVGGELPLRLFDDVKLIAVADKIEDDSLNGFVWRGHLKERPGWVVLVIHQGAIAGFVSTPEGDYGIRYVAGRIHVIEELDELGVVDTVDDIVIPDALYPTNEPGDAKTIVAQSGKDPATIDMLVVYTKRAMKLLSQNVDTGFQNKKKAMVSQIKLSIAVMNQVFENSQIPARVRLVKTKSIKIKFPSLPEALGQTANQFDGRADEIHQWRDKFGADFVMTVIGLKGPLASGLAFLVDPRDRFADQLAFSVMTYQGVRGIVGIHELGHNLGQSHQKPDGAPRKEVAHSYSYGWRSATDGWLTIMANNRGCSSCTFYIPFFSDPTQTFQEAPLGGGVFVPCNNGSPGPICSDEPIGAAKANVAKSIRKVLKYAVAFRPCEKNCKKN